ncbi:procathepsin L-like isoform X2 [Argiope bruennichi]|uniref:procathepsin L-like isoform X2 n=1 Tax=Argiope bruennichi TaxID=94029 RepID=UPI002494CE27|nr:procathepsin L-like isoform X2 [Argiope bruennichi]
MASMRILLILSCLTMAAYGGLVMNRRINNQLWNEFKHFFDKNYDDDEDTMRQNMWNDLLNNMFSHNMKFHAKKVPYSMGLNEFSDMSHDEFTKKMTGLDSEKNCQNSSLIYQPPPNPKIPENVDWREHGYVTEVQNQGACGACWAFCSIGSLEGQHKRKTGQLIKLSEQNLIDCSKPEGNKGCGGGQMCRALEYAAHIPGVATEESYPYIGTSTDGTCKYKNSTIGSKVGGYLEIPYGDEDALKKAVGLLGPIAAGLDGSPETFRHYNGGIYSDPACSNTTLTHALTVIGYGTEDGTDYWLVKNSWGKSWGQGGFGKLLRNSNNHCGIASRALFPVLEQNTDGTPKLSGPAAS